MVSTTTTSLLCSSDPAIENLRAGNSTDMFSFTVAAWIRYLVGKDESGKEIEIKDDAGTEAGLLNMANEIYRVKDAIEPAVVLVPTDKNLVAKFITKVFGCEAGNSVQIVDGGKWRNGHCDHATTPATDKPTNPATCYRSLHRSGGYLHHGNGGTA